VLLAVPLRITGLDSWTVNFAWTDNFDRTAANPLKTGLWAPLALINAPKIKHMKESKMARGGYRPGAGRPRGSNKLPAQAGVAVAALTASQRDSLEFATALEFAMSVINNPAETIDARIRMAIAAMPFQSAKLESIGAGKKDAKAEAAKAASSGRFAAPAPPKLVVDNDAS
jgi:hypothetical protein